MERQVIELEEEAPVVVPQAALAEALVVRAHQRYSRHLQIEFPGPLNQRSYVFRSRGYVGLLPLEGLLFRLKPKVPIRNLFGMIECAYQLNSLQFFEKEAQYDSINEIFELLAEALARRVIARAHQGFYRDYLERQEDLACARGRLLFPPAQRSPLLRCAYQEHTAEVMDNRILAWTLGGLRAFPFQRDPARQQVRRAYKLLAQTVEPAPVRPEECRGRLYHRLNQDYRPLHALCRFFLEHSGPALTAGQREFLPFAIHLPTLFEEFAASWLRAHLPAGISLQQQHRIPLEGSEGLEFQIDLVLRERGGQVIAVLDTKYRREPEPASEDIQQVVAYAVRLGTERAFLIYPSTSTRCLNLQVGQVQVHTLVFDLGWDLEEAGIAFSEALWQQIR